MRKERIFLYARKDIMKKFIPLLLTVFLIVAGRISASCQFASMLQPQNEWIMSHWYWAFPGWEGYTESYQVDNDTLIDGRQYTALVGGSTDKNWLREDSLGKVYHWLPDSAIERVVYDFSLEQGDTFTILQRSQFINWEERQLRVIAVDTIDLLNGEKRKRIRLDSIGFNVYIEWIEGIGSDFGPLYDDCTEFITDYGCHLNCVAQGSELIYSQNGDSVCVYAPIEEGESFVPFDIFPNPWSTALTLEFDNSEWKTHWLHLFDLQGKKVKEFGPFFESPVSLQAGELPEGIYTFCFSNEQGEQVWGKILKQ